jgi:chromosome partitioning protein
MGAKVIAIINQKGGVGKSTTTLAIGAGFSLKGYKTLFIDLDAQGNLTYTLGADTTGLTGKSSFDVLTGNATAKTAIQKTEQGEAIASSPALARADTVITAVGKEYRLKEALDVLQSDYDYIVIDTPPVLGILTINALTACTGVIIPAQADIYSLQGISQLYNTLQTVKKYCNPSLKVMGILLTRYNGRAIISRDIAEMTDETAERLQTKLYETKIRETTAIKEAQARRQSIFTYAPKSNASADYKALVDEILGEEKKDNGK